MSCAQSATNSCHQNGRTRSHRSLVRCAHSSENRWTGQCFNASIMFWRLFIHRSPCSIYHAATNRASFSCHICGSIHDSYRTNWDWTTASPRQQHVSSFTSKIAGWRGRRISTFPEINGRRARPQECLRSATPERPLWSLQASESNANKAVGKQRNSSLC